MKKYIEPMMKTALIWAEMSYCKRRKVGAVIAKDNRIISVGYNGTLQSLPNTCEDVLYKCKHCGATEEKLENLVIHKMGGNICSHCSIKLSDIGLETGDVEEILVTKKEVQHAERNALDICTKNGISTKNCSMFVSTEPCEECAKSIYTAGITEVYYKDTYRNHNGIKLLKSLGVYCEQINLEKGN